MNARFLGIGFFFSVILLFFAVLIMLLGYTYPTPGLYPAGVAILTYIERYYGVTHRQFPLPKGVIINMATNVDTSKENVYEMYGYLVDLEEKSATDASSLFEVTLQNGSDQYTFDAVSRAYFVNKGVGQQQLLPKGSLVYVQWRDRLPPSEATNLLGFKKAPTEKLLKIRPYATFPLYKWVDEIQTTL